MRDKVHVNPIENHYMSKFGNFKKNVNKVELTDPTKVNKVVSQQIQQQKQHEHKNSCEPNQKRTKHEHET